MKDILKVIETLRAQRERHKQSGLKEYPTRTIFIDPRFPPSAGMYGILTRLNLSTRRLMASRLIMP
jgi:hypothetical protein